MEKATRGAADAAGEAYRDLAATLVEIEAKYIGPGRGMHTPEERAAGRDCNGATVGGLFGLRAGIPEAWTRPWAGRVAVSLAGYGELALDELVERTVAVARSLA